MVPPKRRSGVRRSRQRLFPLAERVEERLLLSGATVTNTDDVGPGSLRAAIDYANLNPGSTINFDFTNPAPTYEIDLATALPAITEPVTIDGLLGTGGSPIILINGGGLTGDGFLLAPGSDGSTIENLAIENFANAGIHIQSNNDLVVTNYIGTDLTGKLSGVGNWVGVYIESAGNNTIGGTGSLGNLISGNGVGVQILGDPASPTTGNLLIGNLIGTDSTGESPLPNSTDGVQINSSNNTIGGASQGDLNLISANSNYGINILGGSDNQILGNFIGTDLTGNSALGNGYDGVTDAGSSNTIGSDAGAFNLISGNVGNGISLYGSQDLVLGNLIGTNQAGTSALGNQGDGISDSGSSDTIGGSTAAAANVVSGNQGAAGIYLSGASGELVIGNVVGATPGDINAPTNFQPLGNLGEGIELYSSTGNSIGMPGDGNLVVASGQSGIDVDQYCDSNVVSGNGVGTTLVASSGIGIGPPVNLGNAGDGILLNSASSNIIGGSTTIGLNGKVTSLGGNVISSNGQYGIEIEQNDETGVGNLIQGNLVGTNAEGTSSIPNSDDGILVGNSANNSIGGVNSLNPDGSLSVLKGNLISGNKGSGLTLNGSGTTGNSIVGNRIGTDLAGTLALANGKQGVRIYARASSNVIGGPVSGTGNLISGNNQAGVTISDSGSTANQIIGNRIGLTAGGLTSLPNLGDGILLSAAGNIVGGSAQGAGNVISGNLGSGIDVESGASQTQILGNLIGLDATGTSSGVGNVQNGIEIDDANQTMIGGLTAIAGTGPGNVISGNLQYGIHLLGTTTSTVIEGNIVGLDLSGSAHRGNSLPGILLDGVSGNTVGGTQSGKGNVISNNGSAGVAIENGSTSNLVEGNRIGTDLSGTLALGPIQNGVLIKASTGNTIGGTGTYAGNLISGNGLSGVLFSGSGASGNTVLGNKIGTDVSGTLALGNGQDGVQLDSAVSNTIGGIALGSQNVISGNRSYGVEISGVSLSPQGNVVEGNLIGTTTSGSKALGNSVDGIFLAAGAVGNIIGGSASTAGNLISANLANGVEVFSSATGNQIFGNRIGTDLTGTFALGNDNAGVYVNNAAGNSIGGPTSTAGQGLGNLISGNYASGILISESTGVGNSVQGNLIGLDATASVPLPNLSTGITIDSAKGNLIGGSLAGDSNIIAGNRTYGVVVVGSGATGNQIAGNLVGTNNSGVPNLGNILDGVILNAAPSNTVGGALAGDRNVISDNGGNGIEVINIIGQDGVSIVGNLIGTDPSGTRALGNGLDGILLNGVIGTSITSSALPNVISGNKGDGVHSIGSSARSVIQGNLIGINASGTAGLGNGKDGIELQDAGANTVGGFASGQGNVISGNLSDGIQIDSVNSIGNVLAGNSIGTNNAGGAAVGNGGFGISIEGASNTVVQDSLISGNTLGGVQITGTTATGNIIYGSSIGTDRTGGVALGNGLASQNNGNGIYVNGAPNNRIGGDAPGEGNLISGNATTGVYIFGRFASGNTVMGNRIGTNGSGLQGLTQGGSLIQQVGVLINQAPGLDAGDVNLGPGNTVGGSTPAAGNLISGNVIGIEISSADSEGNVVSGNLVGTSATGGGGAGNNIGVYLNGAPGNIVGGSLGNIISGNASVGVYILGGTSTGNQVTGNIIGLAPDGLTRLPNGSGVYIENAPQNLIGGTSTAARNVISANSVTGVYIVGAQSVGNVVKSNLIGYAANGKTKVGNGQYGVLLYNAPANNVVRSGKNANKITGSGIASFREYTGHRVAANAPLANKTLMVSTQARIKHAAVALHGLVIGKATPSGPIRHSR